MIASLRGKLLENDTNSAVIECGGIGFYCLITSSVLSMLPKIGQEVFLYTYMSVKEDAMDLFGFSSPEELECFKLITTVSGVGPKSGIAILSTFTPEKLALYIAAEDYKSISQAPGIGAKTAQRICLELKDKLTNMPVSNIHTIKSVKEVTDFSSSREAIEALVQLGFSAGEASMAVGNIDRTLSTEELIKEALKTLSRRF